MHPIWSWLLATCWWMSIAEGRESWQVMETGTEASLRGLSAVNQNVVWACGSRGTVVRTLDAGTNWIARTVPGLEQVEIRSIHAWDDQRAMIATAGQPALILKTRDGGANWKRIYELTSPQAFIDGLKIEDDGFGLAFSDPIDSKLLIAKTVDAGDSWSAVDSTRVPAIDVGEAGFAASNSSLFVQAEHAWIGLGGGSRGPSRIFKSTDRGESWTAIPVPPIQRGESAGIFSIAFDSGQSGVAVGGDYRLEGSDEQNIAISDDGGVSWRQPTGRRPRGFRSCVVAATDPKKKGQSQQPRWLACGPSGCDWSSDRDSWNALSEVGFHTLNVSRDHVVWASGAGGRIGRLNWD
jgi:photosystem II stability/assembly factor-like uncharacterized protein